MTAQATVTIPYGEFQAIQEARRIAEVAAADLRQQISETKIAASDPVLLVVARSAIEVVRFAVASLPPESTRGWPTEALKRVAANLPSMPDAVQDDQELAITLMSFARECDHFEQRRNALGARYEE